MAQGRTHGAGVLARVTQQPQALAPIIQHIVNGGAGVMGEVIGLQMERTDTEATVDNTQIGQIL